MNYWCFTSKVKLGFFLSRTCRNQQKMTNSEQYSGTFFMEATTEYTNTMIKHKKSGNPNSHQHEVKKDLEIYEKNPSSKMN